MPENILVRATNWVGDLVMSTPAISSIKANFPGSRVTVLIKPPLDELLLGNPEVDGFIIYDKKGLHSGPAGFARLVKEVRRHKFTRAILLQNAFEAALIAFLAKIPVRVGYRTDGRGMLLTQGVSVSDETRGKHQIFYYLDMLEGAGLKTGAPEPKLYVDKKELKAADSLLEKNAGSDGPVVGINPGAQYGAAKKWHPERFGYVADRLAKKLNARIVVFGGPGDVQSAASVVASMKVKPLNLAGKTTLRQLMALIGRCSLLITNDSGPMHISAALGTPTLALFGSTDPVATGPAGRDNLIAREPVNCSPCLERTCPLKHYHCMERVKPETVLKMAESMLRGL